MVDLVRVSWTDTTTHEPDLFHAGWTRCGRPWRLMVEVDGSVSTCSECAGRGSGTAPLMSNDPNSTPNPEPNDPNETDAERQERERKEREGRQPKP